MKFKTYEAAGIDKKGGGDDHLQDVDLEFRVRKVKHGSALLVFQDGDKRQLLQILDKDVGDDSRGICIVICDEMDAEWTGFDLDGVEPDLNDAEFVNVLRENAQQKKADKI